MRDGPLMRPAYVHDYDVVADGLGKAVDFEAQFLCQRRVSIPFEDQPSPPFSCFS